CSRCFFQAEDGIRDYKVTGVQTCALPISPRISDLIRARESGVRPPSWWSAMIETHRPIACVNARLWTILRSPDGVIPGVDRVLVIGRASCRGCVLEWRGTGGGEQRRGQPC